MILTPTEEFREQQEPSEGTEDVSASHSDRPEWFDEEPPSDVPSYAEAAKLVLKETGVTPIFSYQYRGEFYSDLVLVTYSMESWEGETVSVDMVELERRRVEEKWDDKLANAARTLGVTPTQKPMWHVLPSYF